MIPSIRKWKWILLALLCIVLLYSVPASFWEQYYASSFFILVRKLLDGLGQLIPFPVFILFLTLMLILAIRWFLHFFKEKPKPFLQRCFTLFSFFGFMLSLFFLLWGFNYGRIPLEDKLKLSIKPLSNEQLIQETEATIQNLSALRKSIKSDSGSIPQIIFINNIDNKCQSALDSTLHQFNYPFSSNLNAYFVPNDFLMVFGIGGIYIPFTGEGCVDNAVYYSRKPFYFIHEMAHANGFTQEADCNFLAYVSCIQSKDISYQYCGELNYLLYLLADLKERNKSSYDKLLDTAPKLIQYDLNEIKTYYQEHQFKTAKIGDAINNLYLKFMGVKDGVKNYDKMVLLVYAWKNSK
ncbi:MAG: DUF3810 domain-containing protein [Chitinophagales bacterium]